MKRSSSAVSPVDREFAEFQNAVRGARNHRRVLDRFRQGELSAELFERAIKWLKGTPFRGAPASSIDFPRQYRQVRRIPDPTPATLDREFLWAAISLSPHTDSIKRFLSLAGDFSRSVLGSDIGRAVHVLDAIDIDLGKSIWGMTNRIALVARSQDTAAQKNLATKIRAEANGGEVSYLAFFISSRNETAVSLPSFRSQYRRIESTGNLTPAHYAYLRFHIMPGEPSSRQDLPAILAYESTSPVVDYYETFIRVSRILLKDWPSLFRSAALPAIAILSESIPDPRLAALNSFRTGSLSYLETLPVLNTRAFDDFLSGNYEAALASIESARKGTPDAFEFIELAARVSVAAGEHTSVDTTQLGDELIARMASVLRKDHLANENWLELTKLSTNFPSLPWASMLAEFCSQEYQTSPANEAAHMALPERGLPPTVLFAPYASGLSNESARAYLDRCMGVQGRSLTGEYFSMLCDGPGLHTLTPPDRVDALQSAFLLAHLAEASGLHERAVQLVEPLTNENNLYFRLKAIRLKPKIMLRAGQTEKCVDYITSIFLEDTDLGPLLPIRDTVRSIDSATAQRLRGDLSLSVLYDIYARHFGEDEGGARQFAYEDFLVVHGLSRPSQLRGTIPEFPRAKIIYYLRNICVPQVMDVSTEVFLGSNDLEEERIAVCQLLADIDPARRAEYQTEITEIARRQLIKRRMKEIEQSKIYVDTESIRQLALGNLRESFQRYWTGPHF